jgi:hypothetical protein
MRALDKRAESACWTLFSKWNTGAIRSNDIAANGLAFVCGAFAHTREASRGDRMKRKYSRGRLAQWVQRNDQAKGHAACGAYFFSAKLNRLRPLNLDFSIVSETVAQI